MKKDVAERVTQALEFAERSAEYHVQNYAGGTLSSPKAFADMSPDERDKVYLGPDSGAPNMYTKLYRSQREKEMREQGMTDAQINERWDALNAVWQREIEERLYGKVSHDVRSENLISKYEKEKAVRDQWRLNEQTAERKRTKRSIARLIIHAIFAAFFLVVVLDAVGAINGVELSHQIFQRINLGFDSVDRLSVESTGTGNTGDGAGSGNFGGFVLVYGAVIFLIYKIVKKKKKHVVADDSIVYTELLPQMVREKYGEGSVYYHQGGLPDDQIRRLNCFGGRPFTLDGNPLPIVGRDLIEGTYRGIHFRSSYEYMEYEYYYEDSDGDKEKTIGKLFGGIIVEIPYARTSSVPLGLNGNSELKMKKIVKSGSRCGAGERIEKTENENFNLLFTINCDDEENIFYILTPDVMEKLAALYPKEKTALHVTFDRDRLYMCISKSDKYMIFDEDKPVSGIKDIEVQLDRHLRMLQEVLDAALLL